MKTKETNWATELKRLRKEVEALKSEVNLWRTRYFELAAATGLNRKAGGRGGNDPSGPSAIRESIEAEGRDNRVKSVIVRDEANRRLKHGRGEIQREVRVIVLKQAGKEIRSHLEKQGMREQKALAEFEAWRKARHTRR